MNHLMNKRAHLTKIARDFVEGKKNWQQTQRNGGIAMIKQGISLEWLEQLEITPGDLAYDHRMDISGSIFTRMKELGMTQSNLAEKTGMERNQISRIITGQQNMTPSTLYKLEIALGFRLDKGFVY